MTQRDWLESNDPDLMFSAIADQVSSRKLRLFACALARRLPGLMESEPDRLSVDLTERDVDGLVDVDSTNYPSGEFWDLRWYRRDGHNIVGRTMTAYHDTLWEAETTVAAEEGIETRVQRRYRADLSALWREIVNPFCPAVVPGRMASSRIWRSRHTTSGGMMAPWTRPVWRCWLMRWRTPGVPMSAFSGICATMGLTFAVAGWWICYWARSNPMTEAEWLACDSADAALRFVTGLEKKSNRKLRLFGCACCRRNWYLLNDPRSRRAVEVAEAFADGQAKLKDAQAGALDARNEVSSGQLASPVNYFASQAAAAVVGNFPLSAAWQGVQATLAALGNFPHRSADAIRKENAAQADLLREVFGNPFVVVSVDPAVRTPTVRSLAQSAYDERLLPSGELDPPRLAVLADALEEAGCSDADILGHLRGPGPHVRGCWVVDLLLGKQ
jgi:hypothetical protein